jgi:hypothetical protein
MCPSRVRALTVVVAAVTACGAPSSPHVTPASPSAKPSQPSGHIEPSSSTRQRHVSDPSGRTHLCTTIQVLDPRGRLLTGAIVTDDDTLMPRPTGRVHRTDERGLACIPYLADGTVVRVIASLDLGGRCAGTLRLRYDKARDDSWMIVQLPVTYLARAPLRGRVVSPRGEALVGAVVQVVGFSPGATPNCSEVVSNGDILVGRSHPLRDTGPAVVMTGADGVFELDTLPLGSIELLISHREVVGEPVVVIHDGHAPDVVLQPLASPRSR